MWCDPLITFPFPREASRHLDSREASHSLAEFRADQSPERFDRAIEFMGALFVTCAPEIARQVPEIVAPFEAAASTAEWQAALRSGPVSGLTAR